MAGVKGRSGGHNRISPAEHLLRGTYRPDRHAGWTEQTPRPVSAADRRRVLGGLTGTARRVMLRLLDEYDDWSGPQLEMARAYALSCARLEALQTDPEADLRAVHRETRINMQLYRTLALE